MNEFKVGDKVRFVNEEYSSLNGLEGVVVTVFDTASYKYNVTLGDLSSPTPCTPEEIVLVTAGEGELDLVEETSGLTKVGKTFQGYKENGDLHYPSPEEEEEYTGGSSSYYDVTVNGTEIRCLDIIEALNMNYAEGNAFKAVWRIAASKQGKQKKGNTRLYDAEKVVFFGERLVEEHHE